jgi:transposase
MENVTTVGLDLAKQVFQAHGADCSGAVVFREKLRRGHVLSFFTKLPACTVAMEACGGAHYWGRELQKLGQRVRMIAPAYVKPFVKRQKTDAADAEAICEAAQRPTMRFVPIKSAEKQSAALLFRTRDLLVRQRTQLINALRGHLAEFGIVAAKGPANIKSLIAAIETAEEAIPSTARPILQLVLDQIHALNRQIDGLGTEIEAAVASDDTARRLMTIPGIGPLTAAAICALAPDATTFRCGRDFAAWVGLTPLQRSSGGKERIGRTSRMGERAIRRLLIIGASAVARWASRRGFHASSWLGRMFSSEAADAG